LSLWQFNPKQGGRVLTNQEKLRRPRPDQGGQAKDEPVPAEGKFFLPCPGAWFAWVKAGARRLFIHGIYLILFLLQKRAFLTNLTCANL
jgi:hypothetical protein